MQSMVLQIMGPKYNSHLKYFGKTNGVEFGMRKIVQVLTFQIFIWFYNATLSFIVIKNQSGKGTFWTPCMLVINA